MQHWGQESFTAQPIPPRDQRRPLSLPSKTRSRSGTAGSRFQNQPRSPRFGLSSAKLSWAGLGPGWAPKTRPQSPPSRQRNAVAQRPQTGQKRTKNGAFRRPRTQHLNPVRKSLWHSFGKAHTKAWAELGWAGCWVGWVPCMLGSALLSWAGLGTKNEAPEPYPSKRGNAAAQRPQTNQKRTKRKKRSFPAAENATSESGKKKPLAQLWQGPHQGLGSAGLSGLLGGVGYAGCCELGRLGWAKLGRLGWADLACVGWAGLSKAGLRHSFGKAHTKAWAAGLGWGSAVAWPDLQWPGWVGLGFVGWA